MQHSNQASGVWKYRSFAEQMGHIGGEVERSLHWREKHQDLLAERAFIRSVELIQLTIMAQLRNSNRLRELVRLKECWFDYFVFDNEYHSTADSMRRYFLPFALVAQQKRA